MIACDSGLSSLDHQLDLSSEAFGELHRSDVAREGVHDLRTRIEEDGYLFLPELLDREKVRDARRHVTDQLAELGLLDPDYPSFEAVAPLGSKLTFSPDLAKNNPALDEVLYRGPMIEFFEELLGGEILHFDFTWFRTIAPGKGTPPHCDVVYMGRGTKNLYTAWVPIGDVSYDIGGLMILDRSHLLRDKLRNYLDHDVDTFCESVPEPQREETLKRSFDRGWLSNNPVSLREKLGGRWLTSEYRAGDALIFKVQTIHASLDNQTRFIRFSSDSRYQLASEPADERWIGANPVGHSLAGKRGRIC